MPLDFEELPDSPHLDPGPPPRGTRRLRLKPDAPASLKDLQSQPFPGYPNLRCEIIELEDEAGSDPPRTVAVMRYVPAQGDL